MSRRIALLALACTLFLAAWSSTATAAVSSYPSLAVDEPGSSTGAPSAATGVPNYQFVNDLGLGFGGTNTDVFDVGESTVLLFPVPIRNLPAQHDLILYAFVGGVGAIDSAMVQVEASSDGSNFTTVATFDTATARNRAQDPFENNFEAVKPFFIELGATDNVTHVRLTNLAGTSEGLRLDALEGLHPDVGSTRAFEFRIQRSRLDDWQQFKLRVKNVADPGGVPIREIRVNNSPAPLTRLEQTELSLDSTNGQFICVENCIPICTADCNPNGPPPVPFSRHVWSLDGVTEAPAGLGLAPGEQAAHTPAFGIDTDSLDPYLSGYSFEITFADGVVQSFDYDLDVEKEIGSLYEKHLYFSATPALSWNRPTDFYEFVGVGPPVAVPALSGPAVWMLVTLALGMGGWLIGSRRRSEVR